MSLQQHCVVGTENKLSLKGKIKRTKLKESVLRLDTINQSKTEKFIIGLLTKDLYQKYTKKSQNSMIVIIKTNNPIRKWAEETFH